MGHAGTPCLHIVGTICMWLNPCHFPSPCFQDELEAMCSAFMHWITKSLQCVAKIRDASCSSAFTWQWRSRSEALPCFDCSWGAYLLVCRELVLHASEGSRVPVARHIGACWQRADMICVSGNMLWYDSWGGPWWDASSGLANGRMQSWSPTLHVMRTQLHIPPNVKVLISQKSKHCVGDSQAGRSVQARVSSQSESPGPSSNTGPTRIPLIHHQCNTYILFNHCNSLYDWYDQTLILWVASSAVIALAEIQKKKKIWCSDLWYGHGTPGIFPKHWSFVFSFACCAICECEAHVRFNTSLNFRPLEL